MVDSDFTAETKSSCFHEMKELTIPHLDRCCYLSYKVEVSVVTILEFTIRKYDTLENIDIQYHF